MLTIQEMKDMLEKALPPKRFKHSLGVYETALKMAEHYGMPQEKVAVAALLHDCGREVPTDKQVEKLCGTPPADFAACKNGRLFCGT